MFLKGLESVVLNFVIPFHLGKYVNGCCMIVVDYFNEQAYYTLDHIHGRNLEILWYWIVNNGPL